MASQRPRVDLDDRNLEREIGLEVKLRMPYPVCIQRFGTTLHNPNSDVMVARNIIADPPCS